MYIYTKYTHICMHVSYASIIHISTEAKPEHNLIFMTCVEYLWNNTANLMVSSWNNNCLIIVIYLRAMPYFINNSSKLPHVSWHQQFWSVSERMVMTEYISTYTIVMNMIKIHRFTSNYYLIPWLRYTVTLKCVPIWKNIMVTWWYGNAFRITGPMGLLPNT